MRLRARVALLVLFFATVYWAVWVGGYLFNGLMLVPLWSHDAPASLVEYHRTPRYIAYFFVWMNPWVFLASLAAWLLIRKVDSGGRRWVSRATLLAWILLPLKVALIAMIGRVVDHAFKGSFTPAMRGTIELWSRLGWLAIAMGTAVLVMHLLAILRFESGAASSSG